MTKNQVTQLFVAAVLLLVGTLFLVFGISATYAPMKMAAWLHFGVGAALLCNVGWPLLMLLIEQRLTRDAAARQARAELREREAAEPEPAPEAPAADAATTEKSKAKRLHKARKKKRNGDILVAPVRAVLAGMQRWGAVLGLALALVVLAGFTYLYVLGAAYNGSVGNITYLHVLLLAAGFVVFLVLEKLLKYFASDHSLKAALCAMFDVLRLNLLLMTVGTVISVTGLYDVTAVLRVIEFVVAAYCLLSLVVSLVNGFLRGRITTGVNLVIPRPFSKEESGEEDLITYLEKSTGITLRSLFGVKVARRILPIVVCVVALGFWLSTGITQVEAYEQGVLYRFGRCEKILQPGLHLSLPYPFDKVEVYPTEKVQEMVVGYENSDKTNLLWNESHGGTEYKLLCGDGSELVSVNMRVQYKIDDLQEYITCSAEPEKILNAEAYAAITDLTVPTTLEVFLAEDRAKLSQTIEEKLGTYLDNAKCGLCVVDVIIESIHPPVEVSVMYQQVISAQLQAQTDISSAKGMAGATITYAEMQKYATEQDAIAQKNQQIAEANAAVAEFNAMLAAYENNPAAFCYYKYLAALSETYKGKRLYILGDGIDESYLYFGDGVIIYNKQ